MITAGAGAAGGGLLASLFGTLKVDQTIQNPVIASPGYPLAVFSVVALFVLIAGVFTIQATTRQFVVAILGILLFCVTTVAGALMVYQDTQGHPHIRIVEHFEPSLDEYSERNDPDPVTLSLKFSSNRLTSGNDLPFKDGIQSMIDGDLVDYKIDGLEKLWVKYNGLKSYLDGACAGSTNPVCKIRQEQPQ